MIVKQSPHDSAIHRSIVGPDYVWDLHGHLLGGIYDVLMMANWQRGGDEHAKKPVQLERPGVSKKVDGQVLAQGKAVSTEQMNALLGW